MAGNVSRASLAFYSFLHWVIAYEGDLEILPDPNSFDFQFTGKSFVKLKLSMIFLEASPSG